jgi:hypothetical protein
MISRAAVEKRSPAEASGINSMKPIFRATALPPHSIAKRSTNRIALRGMMSLFICNSKSDGMAMSKRNATALSLPDKISRRF